MTIIEEKPSQVRGQHLRRYHIHSVMIVVWISFLIAYLVAIEQAIVAHKYLPEHHEDMSRRAWAFGRRGTKSRENVVQAFSIARTILTVAHVPLITATLATTLPRLTQKYGDREPPKLSLEQLFLLADRTWAGAGGWYEALCVGNLSWQWWKYTLLVMFAFVGFPIATAGYMTVSQQYWGMEKVYLPTGLSVHGDLPKILEDINGTLTEWVDKPHRDRWNTDIELPQDKDNRGRFSFYPSAHPAYKDRGHFVTFMNRVSSGAPSLMVADTMGVLSGISCDTTSSPTLFKSTKDLTCIPVQNCPHGLCKYQSSTHPDGLSLHSCTAPSNETLAKLFYDPLLTRAAQELTVEFAVRTKSDTHISHCSLTLVPGGGIVDSIIRQYMHFLPFGLGLAKDSPEVLTSLQTTLPALMSATAIPALSQLHRNPHAIVGFYKQVHHLDYPRTFEVVANASFITALPYFFDTDETDGFAYKNDLRIVRHSLVPPGLAPVVLLLPVLAVAWISWSGWSTGSWTGFLDAFAMFRLGRSFEKEMEGFGAAELKECYVVRRLPGWVGDGGKSPADVEEGDLKQDYVGTIVLGGEKALQAGTRYA